ncbi:MAG TPA: YihY/virulence factor BrkB family protein [Chitinispirillaceae bacterium]|nr:YihY/virulence factor BrkB family protein [Chitinispirillaceae bacterium]
MSAKKSSNEDNHGILAKTPAEIPKRGWYDIFKRVTKEISKDNISIIAAGVAFYSFLAIFPAIAATISIYGLLIDPQTVQQQLSSVTEILPKQATSLMQSQLNQITKGSSTALSWGLVFSILLSIWSANSGTSALFQGINIAYDEQNKRGLIKNTALTLLFTFLGIVMAIICISLVIGLPAFADKLGFPGSLMTTIMWSRWILLAGLIILSLAALYRYAADRKNPKWQWVSWGSVIATFCWIGGSLLFSYYVNNFSNYNATYGSLAAVVILLFWFYLSIYFILLGAEINSEIEHQTEIDSTIGKQQPMGKRGAHQADDLGEAA